jgi:hypothetical protein
MITFRKTLMATTMLAGLAIFTLDAAQAGPNGGPSLGSISGFSSMRMDFNRVGGPNRALSRDDMRVIPVEIKKTDKTPKDTKNAAKKGTDVGRVSNLKPAGGGKGKDVASAPALRIPAPLAEIYRVTGGNLDDISQLAEIAAWLRTGLPVAGNPAFPQPGDGTFVPPTLGAGDRLPWGDAENGSGNNTPQQIGNPEGKVAGDAWRTTRQGPTNDGHFIVEYNKQENRYRVTYFSDGSMMYRRDDYAPGREPGINLPAFRTWVYPQVGTDGTARMVAETYVARKEGADSAGGDGKASGEGPTSQPGNEEPHYQEPGPKDSQPTEEGTGRSRGMHTVRCDIAGCLDLGMKDGRRTNPGHGTDGSTSADASGGGLPSWATDPVNPDGMGYTGGRGGSYSGYNPRNEGDGDVDGEGGRRTPM